MDKRRILTVWKMIMLALDDLSYHKRTTKTSLIKMTKVFGKRLEVTEEEILMLIDKSPFQVLEMLHKDD